MERVAKVMRVAVMVSVLVGVMGCAGMVKGQGAEAATTRVTHVVVCWLKTPGDEGARQKLIDRSREFTQIPGVLRVSAGRVIRSERAVVDSSFDVAVVITFRDQAAMRAYQEHPIHKKAVEEVLKPLTARMVIYDVEDRWE